MSLEAKYEELQAKRSPYLNRVRRYTNLTIPHLISRSDEQTKDQKSGETNQTGYQSFGAQVLNHLTNKVSITLFPPQKSFFRLELSDDEKEKQSKKGIVEADLKSMLSTIERKSVDVQDEISSRIATTDAIKLLIATGNALLFQNDKDEMHAIPMDRYVVRRDMDGTLTELVIKEKKFLNSFSKELKDEAKIAFERTGAKSEDGADFYTGAIRQEDGKFKVTQAIGKTAIGDESLVTEQNLPWTALTWSLTYGEDWGRGLVEQHVGDFEAIEALSEAGVKGMVLLSEIKFLVKPGSIIDVPFFARARTGSYHKGNPEDISVIQFSNQMDFKDLQEALAEYKRRVGQVFMLNSANRRDAERVTAVELRLDAVELETALGGVYSMFAKKLQKPMAFKLLKAMGSNLLKGFNPIIITGLDALGRTGDLDKIAQFSEMMTLPTSWPEEFKKRVKFGDYSTTVAAALSMELEWLKSDSQVVADDKKAEGEANQQTLVEGASKSLPQVANNLTKQQ